MSRWFDQSGSAMIYPHDHFGDPRDYALEARQILAGELALPVTLEHCLALLEDILGRG